MENYISEIVNVCKLPFDEISKGYKLILLEGKIIYFSNYKKIVDYSSTKIVLKIHNNTFEINGQNLIISQINKGEIIVSGEIYSCGLGVVSEKKSKSAKL